MRLYAARQHTVEVEEKYLPYLDHTVFVVKGPGYVNVLTEAEFRARYEPLSKTHDAQ